MWTWGGDLWKLWGIVGLLCGYEGEDCNGECLKVEFIGLLLCLFPWGGEGFFSTGVGGRPEEL